jgi:hypothetical protein
MASFLFWWAWREIESSLTLLFEGLPPLNTPPLQGEIFSPSTPLVRFSVDIKYKSRL